MLFRSPCSARRIASASVSRALSMSFGASFAAKGRGGMESGGSIQKAPAPGDRLKKFCSGCIPGIACRDRDIAGVQGKDEQPDQGRVIDSVHFEPLDERLGTQRADDLCSLVRDLGSGFLRGESLVLAVAARSVLAFLCFRFGHAEDNFVDRAVAGTDRESDLVPLSRLGPGRLSLWRQLFAAVFIDVEQDAVLGHVRVEPGALRGRESLAVDSEPIILVPFGEQVLLPDDGECGALVLAELGVLGEEAGPFERLGNLPPERAFAPLRLELLPDGRLILARRGGEGAKLLLSWHVARADLIEDGGMDSRKKTELTNLADGDGEGGRDGVFRPVFGGEGLD